MTYPAISPAIHITASAAQTTFNGPFKLFETSDVKVYLTPVGQTPDPVIDLLTESVDYSITISGDGLTFTMTLVVPATAGDIVTMELDIPNSRTTDYSVTGTFTAPTMNVQLDKLTALIGQTNGRLENRGLLYEATDTLTNGQTTIPKLAANEIWQANALGNIEAVECIDETCSTLRSQLLGQTAPAPGTDNVGSYDSLTGGQTLTTNLNTLHAELRALAQSNRVFTTTGTANTYILTSPVTPATYYEAGMRIFVQIHQTNVDGAVTFNLDGLGAKIVVNAVSRYFSEFQLVAFSLYEFVYDGSIFRLIGQIKAADNQLPVNTLNGFTLSNNLATPDSIIDILQGNCKDTTNTMDIETHVTFEKIANSAWVLGSGNGALPIPLSWLANWEYDVWAIKGSSGIVDFGLDVADPPATLLAVSGATWYQYIGTIFTDAASKIIPFIQTKRTFMYLTPVLDVSTSNPGTSEVLSNLSVPTRKRVLAHLNLGITTQLGDSTEMYLSDPLSTDLAPSTTVSPLAQIGTLNGLGAEKNFGEANIISYNKQIRWRLSASTATVDIGIVTKGYTDFMGQ